MRTFTKFEMVVNNRNCGEVSTLDEAIELITKYAEGKDAVITELQYDAETLDCVEKGTWQLLTTWEFGRIRIVEGKEITSHDHYIRDDVLGEWSYYRLTTDEVVAVHNWEDK